MPNSPEYRRAYYLMKRKDIKKKDVGLKITSHPRSIKELITQ